ncbi:inositol monophosphatase family protein [Aestuariibius sp. 2305UL40-4]|uniref:inositol monophosphatase family protein n=1 Tax=Aestuariibius violaceus TaxID=3234132 RepID=UPI00345E4D9C
MTFNISKDDADALVAVAHRLADAARVETLRYFRGSSLDVADKGGAVFDPVTAADRAAEAAMRAILAEARPQDGILGEEFGAVEGESGLTWVLDPIDGTRAFMSGTPTWGVLIAVGGADGPCYGIIDQPYTGERFEGGFGRARMVRGSDEWALGVRGTVNLGGAVLFTTFPEVGSEAERAAFQRVAAQVRLTRYGMDCYAYALLAAGQIDLVIEAGLAAYDIQAPISVIEASGGIVTDWAGGPVHQGGRAIAAATPEIHAQALALLQDGAA